MDHKKILLIEDERDLMWLYAKRLKKSGYEVLTYPKGESAIHTIKEYRPDLIVMDIKLPGLSGIEICKNMRSLPEISLTPVIFLSAMHQEEEFCINTLKAVGFIKKPCAAVEVVNMINETLSSHSI